MEKQTVDVEYFLNTASKEELTELLTHLTNLNRPSLYNFTNAIAKMVN